MGRSKTTTVSTVEKTKTKPKKPKNKMTEQEIKDWDALYEYVRTNVLGYDTAQSLSSNMCLRLKGLLKNKFMENLNTKDTANYSYQTILNTFKFCMSDIQRALRTCSFKDENHKFNYILKIVEDNINTVYIREKNVEKSKKQIETMSITSVMSTGAKYQTKTETNKASSRLQKMWDEVL